nr:hypothetical protein [Candidatus Sigynarchaeum springense]
MHLAGGEVLVVELLAREGVAPLGVARAVEDVDRPDAVLDEVQRAVEKPAEVVDETARLVDEHEAVAGVGGGGERDLEELVQPRGAVDGDGLAREVAVTGHGRLQELVELGSHVKMGIYVQLNEKKNEDLRISILCGLASFSSNLLIHQSSDASVRALYPRYSNSRYLFRQLHRSFR